MTIRRIRTCQYPHCVRPLVNRHRLTRYCIAHMREMQRAHKRRTWHKRKQLYRPAHDDGDH